MRTAVMAILVTVYVIAGSGFPLMDSPMLMRMMTYHLFHGNVFHLALNCLSLWYVFNPRRRDNVVTLCWSYVIACLCYPLSMRPVIGISNVIYASIGMRTPAFSSSWWHSQSTIIFLVITVLLGLLPQIATTTHIASFACGVAVSAVKRKLNSLDHDIERAAHK